MTTAKAFDEEYWEAEHSRRQWGKYPNEALIRFLLSTYRTPDIRKNTKVLEIGCGAGANMWFAAREGFDAYGFDGSASAVVNANKYLSSENLAANIVKADAANLEAIFPDTEFDVIFDICTMCHISRSQAAPIYKKIPQLLKKGGWFFSVGFEVGTTGCGTGHELEKHTYGKPTEGPLKDIGVVRFTTEEDIRQLNNGLYNSVNVDSLNSTRANGELKVNYLITTAQK